MGDYRLTIGFYAAVIALIYLNRHRLEWPARFVGLYRTKVGLKLMERWGRHGRTVRALGDVGIVAGFAGMLLLLVLLGWNIYEFFVVPGTPPPVGVALPGVPIAGTGITIPLVTGWIALFAIIVIHEFSHGVVARAHGVPVKSSGLMLFGPLAGAFVEPDEKLMAKKGRRVSLAVSAAGPFSNMLTVVLCLALLAGLGPLAAAAFYADDGVVFDSVSEGYPAETAGVRTGVVYDSVNGEPLTDLESFYEALSDVKPGDPVTLSSSQGLSHEFNAGVNPDDPERGYLGVVPGVNLADPSKEWLYDVVSWLFSLIQWIGLISLWLGFANLLPIGPLDGGRMFQSAATFLWGEKRGLLVWTKVSYALVLVLGFVLLFSVGKWLVGLVGA